MVKLVWATGQFIDAGRPATLLMPLSIEPTRGIDFVL